MIEVTKELILSLKSERGGYTKASLKKIGVSWPLKTGWKQRAIGTFVPDFRQNQKLTFIPELKSASEAGLTFRFEMTSFQITEKPNTKSKKPDHFPAVRNKVDEKKLKSLWTKGKQAWVQVPHVIGWVESMRDDPDHFVDASNMVLNNPSPNHFPAIRNKVEEEAWESLWKKGGHEWITEHTPHTKLEDNPPWES